jgi:hypothetical protein
MICDLICACRLDSLGISRVITKARLSKPGPSRSLGVQRTFIALVAGHHDWKEHRTEPRG